MGDNTLFGYLILSFSAVAFLILFSSQFKANVYNSNMYLIDSTSQSEGL